jgi:hypothetical protein
MEQTIMRLHSLDSRSKRNARKQARQLRYCLIQAREYFNAAKVVSLATKPTLQYYGTMCLALAEILLKQTGDSSLDRARQQHRHHGLLFRERPQAAINNRLDASAAALVAASHVDAHGERRGTFELWHRSCRELPLVGKITQVLESGLTTTFCGIIIGALDAPLEQLPVDGVSLLQCLRCLPGMADHLEVQGISPLTLRGKAEREQYSPPERTIIRITVHPSDLATTFFENFSMEAGWVDRTTFRETPGGGGGILELHNDPVNGSVRLRVPHCSPWTDEEIKLWPSGQPLNEFGYLYIALFIAGNYARYFPDKWLMDVESSTPLAVAIEELTELAGWRVPWLCLTELSRTCFVRAA